ALVDAVDGRARGATASPIFRRGGSVRACGREGYCLFGGCIARSDAGGDSEAVAAGGSRPTDRGAEGRGEHGGCRRESQIANSATRGFFDTAAVGRRSTGNRGPYSFRNDRDPGR